jgi:hypothetical protein
MEKLKIQIARLRRQQNGLRFDPNKVLLNPYGRCIARPARRSREAARRPGDNAATALKASSSTLAPTTGTEMRRSVGLLPRR